MARPAKAPELHALHGTVSKATNLAESRIPGGRPRWPKGQSPEARKIFKQLCGQLAQRQQLTEGDQSLITLYAAIWDRWRKAQAHIDLEGAVVTVTSYSKNGDPVERDKPNPHWQIAVACEKQLLGILDRLGLTPQARDKIKPVKAAPESGIVPGSVAETHPELLVLLARKEKERNGY